MFKFDLYQIPEVDLLWLFMSTNLVDHHPSIIHTFLCLNVNQSTESTENTSKSHKNENGF